MPWLIPIGIAAAGVAAGTGAGAGTAAASSATSPDKYNQGGASWSENTGKPRDVRVWLEGVPGVDMYGTGIGQGAWQDGQQTNKDGYDANSFEYGGSRQAGDAIARGYSDMGQTAQQREAFLANYTDSVQDRNRALQARGEQMGALGLQRDAAMGLAPSVAQQQMQAGLDQAMRGQESARASARGAAGIAMADYAAAGNIAAQQQQVNQQMGILRANEMAQARDAYQQGATGMRGQDYSAAQQAAGMSQFQAQQQSSNRAQNDAFSQGMFGLAEGVRGQQLGAQGRRQGLLQAGYSDAQHLKAAAAAQAAGEHAATVDQAIRVGSAVANGVSGGGSAGMGGKK